MKIISSPSKFKVNLVIPVLNPEASQLLKTIKSVLNGGDIPLALHVQNGSTNHMAVRTLKKIEKTIEIQNRTREFPINFSSDTRCDKGLYHAINIGFEQMNLRESEIMCWLGSGDVFARNCFVILREIVETFPTVRWLTGIPVCRDKKGRILEVNTELKHTSKFLRYGLCDGNIYEYLQQESTFWKVSLWNEIHGLQETYQLAGDWDLWRRMAKIESIYNVRELLGSFTIHEGQKSEDQEGYRKEIVMNKEKLSAVEKLKIVVKRNKFLLIEKNKISGWKIITQRPKLKGLLILLVTLAVVNRESRNKLKPLCVRYI